MIRHLRAFGRDLVQGRYTFALGLLAAVYAVQFGRPHLDLRTILIVLTTAAALIVFVPRLAQLARRLRVRRLTRQNGAVR